MSADQDLDPDGPMPSWGQDAVSDLQLDAVLAVFGRRDVRGRAVARAALLHPLTDPQQVRYRHEVLADCARNLSVVVELYELAVETLAPDRDIAFALAMSRHSAAQLQLQLRAWSRLRGSIDRLRVIADDARAHEFRSAGFTGFWSTVRSTFDDDFLRSLDDLLHRASFEQGTTMSAQIGNGGALAGLVPRVPRAQNHRMFGRAPLRRPSYDFTIPERDIGAAEALSYLEDRALSELAEVVAVSVESLMSTFARLRDETAFYLGVLDLRDELARTGVATCLPVPLEVGTDTMDVAGLTDPGLALRSQAAPVGTDVTARETRLLVVTGANHGGKSTFLRAAGIAQLMAGAGMFVAASAYEGSLAPCVLPHWNRQEDASLTHGRLDAELARMSALVDEASPGAVLLSNESFSSTNEAEGSQLAFEVITALAGAGIRVWCVTHLYTLSDRLARDEELRAVCLRAPRAAGGARSYRLEAGTPLRTSFAQDLYEREFGDEELSRAPAGEHRADG